MPMMWIRRPRSRPLHHRGRTCHREQRVSLLPVRQAAATANNAATIRTFAFLSICWARPLSTPPSLSMDYALGQWACVGHEAAEEK